MSNHVDITRIEKWRALFVRALETDGESIALREILTALKQAIFIVDAHTAGDAEFTGAINALLLTKRAIGRITGDKPWKI